jgi:hypothetical protein
MAYSSLHNEDQDQLRASEELAARLQREELAHLTPQEQDAILQRLNSNSQEANAFVARNMREDVVASVEASPRVVACSVCWSLCEVYIYLCVYFCFLFCCAALYSMSC